MAATAFTPLDMRSAPRRATDTSASDRAARSGAMIDLAWIGFLVLASGAGTRLGLSNGERLGWLVVDAIVVVQLLRRPRFAASTLRHWLLMSWGALACLSTLWSQAPMVSAYHGLQLVMTIVAGLMFTASAGLERIVRVVFLSLLVMALMSLAFNFLAPQQSTGWQGAWMGAFAHKNTLGSMMALLIVTSIVLLLADSRPTIAVLGLGLGMFLLVMSRSGTAMIATLVTVGIILPFAFLRRRLSQVPLMAGVALIGFAAAITMIGLSGLDLPALLLDSVGKDATLTGRSLLWDFGIDAFLKRPLYGYGFKGWWEGETTTVLLLRFAIGSDLWLFHNNFIEVAVAFGLIGPILLAAGLLWALTRSIGFSVRAHSIIGIWPLGFMLLLLFQTLSENPLFHNHSTLQFLFAAAASAVAPRPGLPAGRS